MFYVKSGALLDMFPQTFVPTQQEIVLNLW